VTPLDTFRRVLVIPRSLLRGSSFNLGRTGLFAIAGNSVHIGLADSMLLPPTAGRWTPNSPLQATTLCSTHTARTAPQALNRSKASLTRSKGAIRRSASRASLTSCSLMRCGLRWRLSGEW